MIRAALLWLVAGYTVGGLMLLNKGVPVEPWLWALRAAHVQMLLAGWLVQFACGVAFWILPRLDAAGSRGDERPVWGCFVALNVGVTLGALAGPLELVSAQLGWPSIRPPLGLPSLAGLLYLLAAILFVVHAWPRVVAFRLLPRPQRQGE
jgi:hypothetical protein